MPKFFIGDIDWENSETKKYLENLQDDIYDQYNKTTVLANTYAYKGVGADAMKKYLSTVGYNSINHMLNIMENLKTLADKEKELFMEVEPSGMGQINTEAISKANTDMSEFNISLNDYIENANRCISDASEYMEISQLSNDEIGQSFYNLSISLINLQNEISAMDTTLQTEVTSSKDQLQIVDQFINNASSNYFTVSGNVNFRKMDELNKADWNKTAENNILKDMQKDDPFLFVAGGNGASYTGEGNVFYAEGQFSSDVSGFEIGGAKVRTDNIYIDVLNGGASISMNGNNVTGASAQANFFTTSGNFDMGEYTNAELEYEMFTADAYINTKANSWNDFSFGAGATATAVGGGGGINIGPDISADTGEDYKFFHADGSIGASVGGGINISNEIVGYREDGTKITQGTFDCDLFFVGFSVSFTY